MGRSTDKETGLSEQRKYRSWTAQQKLEIVLAGVRGETTDEEEVPGAHRGLNRRSRRRVTPIY